MPPSDRSPRHEELGVEGDGTPYSRRYSSSPALSSPPRSSPEAPDAISKQLAKESASRHDSSITVATSSADAALPTSAVAPPVRERKKPGRKPKIHYNPDGSIQDPQPRRRAPRKPKDPNAPPQPRKRKATSSDVMVAPESRSVSGKQPRLSDPELSTSETKFAVPPNLSATQNGNIEGIPVSSFFSSAPATAAPTPPPPPPPPPPIVRSSGQNYDPIRSNYNPVREAVAADNQYNNSQASPQAPYAPNRASESPSISSLVDPPHQAMTSPSIATQSFFNQQHQARLQSDGRTSIPASPTTNRLAASPQITVDHSPAPTPTVPPTVIATATTPAKKDVPPPTGPAAGSKKSTATSSTAASPKPHKTKDKERYPTPPPLPGSGLMQLGGTDGTEFRAPTVCFEVKIAPGEGNKYVNFTRIAEERYGWDALHPRLAAQRERLARVAAAGAALERSGNKESGDEASDDSDSENDVEMGGMSDSRIGTDTGEKKVVRKRILKEDMYDKDDGFVDDSELQWEEQAVAANDGFFVYSGPLVPETAKPEVESAPKRGRGRSRGGTTRGGGPGSRGGRVSGAAAAAAAAAANGTSAGRPASGPGSRGGAVTRKPRITKADRARMEQEKLEREKMGTLATMPNGYQGMPLGSNLGTTPMVFNQ